MFIDDRLTSLKGSRSPLDSALAAVVMRYEITSVTTVLVVLRSEGKWVVFSLVIWDVAIVKSETKSSTSPKDGVRDTLLNSLSNCRSNN